MPVYETIYIAQPGLTDAEAEALGNTYEQLVKDADQSVMMKSDRWGKKKLAYAVQKHSEGLYYHLQYEARPATVTELERRLRHNEQVIKFLSVRLTRQAIEALNEAEKKAAERAAARAQREAERATRLATEQQAGGDATAADDEDDDKDADEEE